MSLPVKLHVSAPLGRAKLRHEQIFVVVEFLSRDRFEPTGICHRARVNESISIYVYTISKRKQCKNKAQPLYE